MAKLSQRHDSSFSSLCLSFFSSSSSSSSQLSYKKKRKVEKSPLCEEFMEQASRPQELINMELLEVSTDSACDTLRVG